MNTDRMAKNDGIMVMSAPRGCEHHQKAQKMTLAVMRSFA